MLMKTMARMNTPLDLIIQYACDNPRFDLQKWPIKQWVEHTLADAFHDEQCPSLPFPAQAELTIRIVDEMEGQQLNQLYRHKETATNVLTFAYEATPNGLLHADIVLCLPVIVTEAQKQHKALSDHAAHLVIHGVLHALGYDHNTDAEAQHMETLEVLLLKNLAIANPYQTDTTTGEA